MYYEGLSSDVSLKERLNEIETRLRKLELAVGVGKVVVDKAHLCLVREAAERFLELSKRTKGQWKGTLSAVEEVRKMREGKQVY